MPVRKDPSGRRYVQAAIEVPGTPEEVWNAIATGPGISSWFVPTELEADKDGTPRKVIAHFAPDSSMDAVAAVTAWEPPRRFIGESPGEGPNAPPVATEWTVEARSGGTCIVRVVHSWFASSDDWDSQFEGTEAGWAAFFRILRLYLASFKGMPCSAFQVMAFSSETVAAAWSGLTNPLGLAGAREGQRVRSTAGAPRLSGRVERVGVPEHPELLLHLDEPAPGIVHGFAMSMRGNTCIPIRVFLYGEQASAIARREEPVWAAWMAETFHPVVDANAEARSS
jgi:uncharacterized protein YndB with AHSA1/START domain